MKRECSGFCPESNQKTGPRHIKQAFIRTRCGCRKHFSDHQSSQFMVEQEQSHQHDHTAGHRNSQIRLCRPDCILRLFLNDPYIGSKGHNLEEYKCSIKISRIKDSHRCPQSPEQEQVESVFVFMIPEIFSGKNSHHHPHQRSNASVNSSETVQRKPESESTDSRYLKLCTVHSHKRCRCQEFADSDKICQIISAYFPVFSRQIHQNSSQKRIKHQNGK